MTAKAPGGAPTGRPAEVRLPATVATVVAFGMYATLPDQLLGGARYVVVGLLVVLLAPLVAANPVRMSRQNRRLRLLSLGFATAVIAANTAAFGFLVHRLVAGHAGTGAALLLAALQVWFANLIGFALVYWELDRGGPVVRATAKRSDVPDADWRFSQDEDDDASPEVARTASRQADWRPRFVDYLYLSTTNSTAFSPTDTMPLSPRAKLLMGVQSIEALLMSILVIARGVSMLH